MSNQNPHRRWGISLLEVLISIGVLAIGLLGVSALIPVAGHQAEEGLRYDRMSSVGKRAFRDLFVRDFLNRSNWYLILNEGVGAFGGGSGNQSLVLAPPTVKAGTVNNVDYYQPVPYCLDPLLRTLSGPGGDPPTIPVPGGVRNIVPGPTLPSLPWAEQMKEILISQDDLRFDRPSRARSAPVCEVLKDGPNGAALKRFATGAWSWMALAVPEYPTATVNREYDGPYVVSVAVFENRVRRGTTYKAYNIQAASIDNMSIAGGTIQLQPFPKDDASDPGAFKPGSWVLIAGSQQLRLGNQSNNPPYFVSDLKWYRILAADYDARGNPTSLSLDGPDWRMSANQITRLIVPFDKDPQKNGGKVLPWQVVSVYSKTMRL